MKNFSLLQILVAKEIWNFKKDRDDLSLVSLLTDSFDGGDEIALFDLDFYIIGLFINVFEVKNLSFHLLNDKKE
jgi:hypothetical protein